MPYFPCWITTGFLWCINVAQNIWFHFLLTSVSQSKMEILNWIFKCLHLHQPFRSNLPEVSVLTIVLPSFHCSPPSKMVLLLSAGCPGSRVQCPKFNLVGIYHTDSSCLKLDSEIEVVCAKCAGQYHWYQYFLEAQWRVEGEADAGTRI